MGYIYKITNDINNKIYIGKTEFSLEERFAEHCRDSKKQRCEKRPLYDAMQKYGIEHFNIKEIEETNNLEEREKYWIKTLRTYIGFSDCQGYNATLGGDGKTLIDYDLIIDKFLQGLNIHEISKETGYDLGHISKILKSRGITSQQIDQQALKSQEKQLYMLDKKSEIIVKTFKSVAEASQYCIDKNLSKDTIKGISAHISQCCNGIRKTAYQHKWSYI